MPKQLTLAALLIPIAFAVIFVFNGIPAAVSRFFAASAAVGVDSLTASSTIASSTAEKIASTTPPQPTLTDVLTQIQNQELYLTKEVVRIETKLGNLRESSGLKRDLKRGDSGLDVELLQQLLAETVASTTPNTATSTIATTSLAVTGYFGRMTERALIDYQQQQGLTPSGIVDSATRDALTNASADQFIPVTGANFAPIDLSTVSILDNSQTIQGSTTVSSSDNSQTIQGIQTQVNQLAATTTVNQSAISDLQGQASQLSSQISQLSSQIADLQNTIASAAVAPTASSAPAPTTPTAPSTPATTISNVQAGSVTNSAASITWTTNNAATSEVDYSTSSSLPSTQTKSQASSTMITSHNVKLSSLTASTTYFYRAVSADSIGTTVKSGILSFTTMH